MTIYQGQYDDMNPSNNNENDDNMGDDNFWNYNVDYGQVPLDKVNSGHFSSKESLQGMLQEQEQRRKEDLGITK
jgi:hypothetical protein